jgi:hypothetical protein
MRRKTKYTVEVRWVTQDGVDSDYMVLVSAVSIEAARFQAIAQVRYDQEIESFGPGEKILIRAIYKGHLVNLYSETESI